MIDLHRPGAGKNCQRAQVEGGIGHRHLAIGVTKQFANLSQAAASGKNGAGGRVPEPVCPHCAQPRPGCMPGHNLAHGSARHRRWFTSDLQEYLPGTPRRPGAGSSPATTAWPTS